ncbi:unnamed protein product [Rangifer tarandus platyrhynchus]|uniref:Uncharacterized protein n=1 Tax=Rangifer tarandus platyrhynchus TaxID=3082113 RepID=A0ABN8Z031_RANTA|nr:unnamed protein product [Rangifer tarandus platyrhynchus]
MSLEKGALFGYPLGDRREWRGKPQRAARGRDKARCQGARGQARTFGLSQLEPGSRGAQTMREKLWMPWNGLIVIGRKMELLGRKTRRPKTWDPKLESENWRLEDVEKTVLRGKSGRSPERMDVKRVRSVSSALQISAGLRKDSSKEVWGKQEFRHTVEAESESAGAAVGSRKGPAFKEKLKFTDVETSGEDLRSRGYEVKQNEEELRSSGEKLSSSGEKLRSSGEELRSSGEELRSSGEKLNLSGEKLESREERRGSRGERRGSRGERRGSRGERRGSRGERRGSRGEKLGTSGEKLVPRRERRGSRAERRGSGAERRGSRGGDLGTSGEELRSTGDKQRSSTEKQRSSREKLGTSGDKLAHSRMGSINEEQIEKVVEVIGDERLIEITNAEMEIPFESVEANDEEENEEGVGEEEDILEEENNNSDESVSMEEKAIIEEEEDEVSEEMENIRRKEEQIGDVLQVKEEKLE